MGVSGEGGGRGKGRRAEGGSDQRERDESDQQHQRGRDEERERIGRKEQPAQSLILCVSEDGQPTASIGAEGARAGEGGTWRVDPYDGRARRRGGGVRRGQGQRSTRALQEQCWRVGEGRAAGRTARGRDGGAGLRAVLGRDDGLRIRRQR